MPFFPDLQPSMFSVKKIWDHALHNAFTDLIFFQGRALCVFREGPVHYGGTEGVVRLIGSEDGERWHSVALIEKQGVDLRDPKLSIAHDGRLMLLAGGAIYRKKKYISSRSYVAFSQEAQRWSDLLPILGEHEWLWRLTWQRNRAYGVAYSTIEGKWRTVLFETENGVDYQRLAEWGIPGHPNETTLRFLSSGEMIALVRRDQKGDREAFIGRALPPYHEWTWSSAGFYLGGPNFLIADDRWMVAAGRSVGRSPYGVFPHTILAEADLQTVNPLTFKLTLPSGGDTSYPGMAFHANQLWVSYYSGHEGRAAIYLARFKNKGP